MVGVRDWETIIGSIHTLLVGLLLASELHVDKGDHVISGGPPDESEG